MLDRLTDLDELSASITELQIKNEKTEAHNRHQNELLRATLEAMPSIIMYLDKELKIIWANPTAAKFASMTPDGLVGQFCYTAMGWEDECKYCPAKSALKLNRSQAQDITRGERTFEVSAEPVRNNGHSGTITVHRDVSHRIRNTEMVRQLLQRAQALCDASSEGIIIYCGEKILVVNKAFSDMIGYNELELKGDNNLPIEKRLIWQIVIPEHREKVKGKIRNDDLKPCKLECITRTGEKIFLQVLSDEIEYGKEGLCRVAIITPWEDKINVRE
jgi:PAS domain S-box-containing protein